MKTRPAHRLVLLAAAFVLPACLACRVSRTDPASPHGTLRDCITKIPFGALVEDAAPHASERRNTSFASTMTQVLFEGRQHWSQELSSHHEIHLADESGFAGLCSRLEESLRSSCGNVSDATVGSATPPSDDAVAASCTLFLTDADEAAVVSAMLLPQSTGSRLLVLAHGW